jgi:hypothetical protein
MLRTLADYTIGTIIVVVHMATAARLERHRSPALRGG